MNDRPDLSVVIPAYNEAERIGPTLHAISSYLGSRNIAYEIIVVSDGSTDSTNSIVEDYSSRNTRIRLVGYRSNRGKGCAARTGMLEARAGNVLLCDADLATPIEDLELLHKSAADGFEVIVGSRALIDSVIIGWRPWYREISGKVFNIIARLLAVPDIHDTQCGFKYFTGGSATRIFSLCRLDGFGFDVEALFLARKLGYRTAEVAVRWSNSPRTKVSVLRDTLPMVIEVITVRWNNWKRRYESPQPND